MEEYKTVKMMIVLLSLLSVVAIIFICGGE